MQRQEAWEAAVEGGRVGGGGGGGRVGGGKERGGEERRGEERGADLNLEIEQPHIEGCGKK